MELWRKVWRYGIVPCLNLAHLEALKGALERDDPALLQGATTYPPPLQAVRDWPVERACALSYCGWKGGELMNVEEVEEFFARTCYEIDRYLHEPAGCRWFLNWFDETPREEMIAALLPEVKEAIALKEGELQEIPE